MADHTKEPWLCDKRTVYALNKNWFNTFSAVVQDCHTSNSELEANARRIVACVNYCEGISTENLEYGLPVKELAQQPAVPSEQQRKNWQLLVSMYEKGQAVSQKGGAA